jgi:hypothetical protein
VLNNRSSNNISRFSYSGVSLLKFLNKFRLSVFFFLKLLDLLYNKVVLLLYNFKVVVIRVDTYRLRRGVILRSLPLITAVFADSKHSAEYYLVFL